MAAPVAVLDAEAWALPIATSRVVRSEELVPAPDPHSVSGEGKLPTRALTGGVDAVRVMRAGNALVSSTCSGWIAQDALSLSLSLAL